MRLLEGGPPVTVPRQNQEHARFRLQPFGKDRRAVIKRPHGAVDAGQFLFSLRDFILAAVLVLEIAA